jgi:RNA-directed DNA polymerase
VAQPEERKFLRFSISNDGSERHIAPTALGKFKAQIRDMTVSDGLTARFGQRFEGR